MEKFGVYILESKKTGKFYLGSTGDFERRLKEHNAGKVASTRKYAPWKLVRFFPCKDYKEATFSERRLKKYKNKSILEKVIVSGVFPWDYQEKAPTNVGAQE